MDAQEVAEGLRLAVRREDVESIRALLEDAEALELPMEARYQLGAAMRSIEQMKLSVGRMAGLLGALPVGSSFSVERQGAVAGVTTEVSDSSG